MSVYIYIYLYPNNPLKHLTNAYQDKKKQRDEACLARGIAISKFPPSINATNEI